VGSQQSFFLGTAFQNIEGLRLAMRTQTLRLAVLSYLTIVLLLWMARILAVSGLISLPFGFSAVGAQANLVTGGLFLALGPGILGMRVLNRRQRLESAKSRSNTN
jgi:hypothetical protein